MEHLKFTTTCTNRSVIDKKLVFVAIMITVLIVLSFLPSQAQDYTSESRKRYKSYYKKRNAQYRNACNLLEKKKNQKPKKVLVRNRKPRPMAETDPTTVVAKVPEPKPKPKPEPETKPVSRPLPITPKIEHISAEKLVALHKKEDQVLAENKLPLPTSQKQEQVRKIVADKLASKTNVYPLTLAPLYFNFNQDEFSVVDMEPFLIAAEYALQGRTVLIEGHTDSFGNDNYNVQLSIKRVQKIRQLMLDMGVPDDRISIVGYGEEMKDNTNKTTAGRQLNRRVDFTIF